LVLPSFPTRRSSDLLLRHRAGAVDCTAVSSADAAFPRCSCIRLWIRKVGRRRNRRRLPVTALRTFSGLGGRSEQAECRVFHHEWRDFGAILFLYCGRLAAAIKIKIMTRL